jgi:hypothetical protein
MYGWMLALVADTPVVLLATVIPVETEEVVTSGWLLLPSTLDQHLPRGP